jgi:Tfp pilus assembly protein PilE
MCQRTCVDNGRSRPGIVLLITLVILVILATLAYTLSAKVAARRHRNEYLIDHAQAQYACASAMKYTLASLNKLDAKLISRPNEPDFSDVFGMSNSEYQAMLARFEKQARKQQDGSKKGDAMTAGPNDSNDAGAMAGAGPRVPGPYGPAWPLVMTPYQFEVATAQVKIEIEDENARYPLGWALLTDEKLQPLANVSLMTFCEWMKYSEDEINALKESLGKMSVLRSFKMTFTPVSVTVTTPVSIRNRPGTGPATGPTAPPETPLPPGAGAAPRGSPSPAASTTRGSPSTSEAAGTVRPAPRRTLSPAEQEIQQSADMARLFRGGMIDGDLLSRPTVVGQDRTESAMKYIGLWGARQVNVNTAPRNVLESALVFGSVADAPKIAAEIISQRRIKPFNNIDELKKTVYRYADSIDKCRDFITTASTTFTIRVTAVSGVAQVVAVAGVTIEGGQVKRIAVLSE